MQKRFAPGDVRKQNSRSMTAEELETRIITWAREQPDVEALIQFGSRAHVGGEVDAWSDWDYHLIVNDRARFRNVDWPAGIAPCWSAHSELTERNVAKLSAVFAGGWEVDFVPLVAWQMKLVYWTMARPGLRGCYPKPLLEGIRNTQLILRPGYRVLLGGATWERRLAALAVMWPARVFTDEDFRDNVSGFWRHAVWVAKKILRGESRAALRWYHAELSERRLALLAEEARLAGRKPRPEARKAEKWLDARRLEQTSITTSADPRVLSRALLAEIDLFEEVSSSVAGGRGFVLLDYRPVAEWLRAELACLA